MKQCPICNGDGFESGWGSNIEAGTGRFVAFDCRLCDTKGQVTDDKMAQFEHGRLMRNRRIEAEITFREFCARHHLDPSYLSDMEFGIVPYTLKW